MRTPNNNEITEMQLCLQAYIDYRAIAVKVPKCEVPPALYGMSPTPSRLQGERVTLPPIRDILGGELVLPITILRLHLRIAYVDELAHPSTSQHVSQSPTFSLRPLNSALNADGSPRVPMRDLSRSSSALRLVHHVRAVIPTYRLLSKFVYRGRANTSTIE